MKACTVKQRIAPGFQGFEIRHGGNGEFLLVARLSSGRVLTKEIDLTTAENLRQARMSTLEKDFGPLVAQAYASLG